MMFISMTIVDLGYNENIEKLRVENNLLNFEIGRVISEHKERYIVKTEKGESEAEITGNLRFTAKGREDFPAVGDWVALTMYEWDFSIIHKILPRFSTISRQSVGQSGEIQIIVANIDYAFLVQAVEKGDIDKSSYDNYLKLEREKSHFESTVAEKRKKDKEFGKMLKNYKKGKSTLN